MSGTIENLSLEEEITWTGDDGLEYRELARQEYANFAFSAGEVLNHPADTFYIMWDKEGAEGGLLLRPDEVAALSWLCASLLWSYHLERIGNDEQKEQRGQTEEMRPLLDVDGPGVPRR